MLKVLIVGLRGAGKNILERINHLIQVKILGVVVSKEESKEVFPDLEELSIPILKNFEDLDTKEPNLDRKSVV